MCCPQCEMVSLLANLLFSPYSIQTEIYRRVFHAVPDDNITTWKQYKEFVAWHERLNKPVCPRILTDVIDCKCVVVSSARMIPQILQSGVYPLRLEIMPLLPRMKTYQWIVIARQNVATIIARVLKDRLISN